MASSILDGPRQGPANGAPPTSLAILLHFQGLNLYRLTLPTRMTWLPKEGNGLAFETLLLKQWLWVLLRSDQF